MFSTQEQKIICNVLSKFYFHCNYEAIDNFSNQPSVTTYALFLYASIPWFCYAIPLAMWILLLFYIIVHRNRFSRQRWFYFVIQRNLLVLREMYHVSKHCLLQPRSFQSNLKLIWKTWWIIAKDDVDMIRSFFNLNATMGAQLCQTSGCPIFSMNSVCIQCRIDNGRQARLNRIYTLLLIRNQRTSVWHNMPLDVMKEFLIKYFIWRW